MHHVFVNTPAAWVIGSGPYAKIRVSELAPDAQDLHDFRVVALNQKVVLHGRVRA
jgi:hypothetical protein